ncbi:4Fe-4S binding protein [Colwellia psychrerythraea]|uniref:4Fe-4S ferredoxin iron-sulfur binding domain-containing protein n=1 Tax=Colwellia psychrerythraea TaxID=28229 RepID=A0A099KW19_COLPS|nr:4Fe-4S dicluster domain-containing protein [Colwellia psychrerythraea]KGJ93848.1 4Fe-4S ferredoxin iron-sulfur binding domain-containing protein [Colwellia psychrerythraea]
MHNNNTAWIAPVRKSGVTFFTLGFLVFIGMLFSNQYKLTEQTLKPAINNSTHLQLIQPHLNGLMNETVTNKISFINDIRHTFSRYNDTVYQRYHISTTNIDALLTQVNTMGYYDLAMLTTTFNSQDDYSTYKIKKLTDYTSWLAGQQGKTLAEISEVINEKSSEINAHVLAEKSIDNYAVGQYIYALVKSSSSGVVSKHTALFFIFSVLLATIGALMYIIPEKFSAPAGIKNDNIFKNSATNGGLICMLAMTFLVLVYIALYFFPEYIIEWVSLVDPLFKALNGQGASPWSIYGFIYTLAIIVMGIRMFIKYRHSNYHIVRTGSIIFFQSCFAFLLPEILIKLNQPSTDLKNMWPLDYDFFDAWNLDSLSSSGDIGMFMLVWGITLFVIGVPLFTYLFGKRWYCSWVCGCGGLAETAGDPYRHLSNKSVNAWRIERVVIHSVLVLCIIMTGAALYTYFTGIKTILGIDTYSLRSAYGFFIGALFSGIVGTGFYPKLGNRVWCRFGCPLAAYIGLIQRYKSRFRITTNGSQCISCGNCSTYCEMGIDVRAYAQRGEDIVRASCVGCGVCSSVCPRGVLKLENGSTTAVIDHNMKDETMNIVQILSVEEQKSMMG